MTKEEIQSKIDATRKDIRDMRSTSNPDSAKIDKLKSRLFRYMRLARI